MASFEEFAAAKINLTLEVLGRRPDGYHALQSLVAFALDTGDRVTLEAGHPLSLEVAGPEAGAIDGPNLMLTVAEAMKRRQPGLALGRFHLEKRLPVASGIGGGSADAAAAIRAIARANGIADPEARFCEIAAGLGADIPVCIGGGGKSAAFMSGIGEIVWRPSHAPLLPVVGIAAVLANPRQPVPTGAVFKALDAPLIVEAAAAQPPSPFSSPADCIAYIKASRNDLEAPAIVATPVIGDVLSALGALSGCRLARMSGSGATCFALFDDLAEAEAQAARLRAQEPGWWVEPTRLF